MKIKDMLEFENINRKFESGEFRKGKVSELIVYSYEEGMNENLTPGHYVNALDYGKIEFKDIPKEYLTRDFFLRALSGVDNDILTYVKARLGEEFDRDFFKDYIASNRYALTFEENCFEYMPLEYIDEEMVSCAMVEAVRRGYCEGRGTYGAWFYSVARRKPSVFTQDFWFLGARLCAKKGYNGDEFLTLTPEQYKTEEYYFAMCQDRNANIMEEIPEEILTTKFLIKLINDNVENIKCFSEEALERKAPMEGREEELKFWQAAIILNGDMIRFIPLNDERVEFFLQLYPKDSLEYRSFKNQYKRYLRDKRKSENIENPGNNGVANAANTALFAALAGVGINSAIDMADAQMRSSEEHYTLLPIEYGGRVPKQFCKKYDTEEYLLEIYKKLGIEVIRELDSYWYEVKLPQNLKIERDSYAYYFVKDSSDNVVLKYRDVGPFYDRSVDVREINCCLDN